MWGKSVIEFNVLPRSGRYEGNQEIPTKYLDIQGRHAKPRP